MIERSEDAAAKRPNERSEDAAAQRPKFVAESKAPQDHAHGLPLVIPAQAPHSSFQRKLESSPWLLAIDAVNIRKSWPPECAWVTAGRGMLQEQHVVQ